MLVFCFYFLFFFFFKQKTAYELRISDWSSDVCSSDLHFVRGKRQNYLGDGTGGKPDHIGKIVSTYQHRTEEPRYARRVPMAEIEENGFNLNISRDRKSTRLNSSH